MSQQDKPSSKSHSQTLPDNPVGCYLPFLLFLCAMVAMGYFYVVFYANVFGGRDGFDLFSRLVIHLYTPLALILSWMLAGILICALLYLWFQSGNWFKAKQARLVFVAVAGIAIIWWITGLTGYLKGVTEGPGQDIVELFLNAFLVVFLAPFGQDASLVMPYVSPILTFVLALGVLAVPVGWYRRSAFGPFVIPIWFILFIWFVLWLTLFFGMGEYQVGLILLMSMIIGCAFFMAGLYLTSGFLLPIPGREHWRNSLGFLRDWAQGFNFPGYVIVDEPYEEDRVETRVPGNASSDLAEAPGFVLSDANFAVAISSKVKFKGVKGPGVVFIHRSDQIVQVIVTTPRKLTKRQEELLRELGELESKNDSKGLFKNLFL